MAMERMDIKRIIEAILFCSPRPVTIKALKKRLDEFSVEEIAAGIEALMDEYNHSDRAIEIWEVSGGFQMRTRIEYKEWVKRFVREKDMELTQPVLETLAIVAYRQPITKKEIDGIRGVDSSRSIRQLLQRRLVQMAGREGDGRQLVFKTTDRFLEVYGLKSIADLPTARELKTIEG